MAPRLRAQVTALAAAVSLGAAAALGTCAPSVAAPPAPDFGGSSVTGSSVTGSSVTGSSVTGSSVAAGLATPPEPSDPMVDGDRDPTDTSDASGAVGPVVSVDRADGPLAGRRAGLGQVRPGRATEPEIVRPVIGNVPEAPPAPRPRLPLPRPVPPSPPSPVTPQPPEPSRGATPPADPWEEAARRPAPFTLEVLPLGTGILLVGLGLGFLAMRLRRR
ncbi:hypothetical protein ACIQM4_10995 [Streptomyces sp. NPDC091272]|uniref:hypothetical protein n=1 Tax=Streptomyces sp. NPDC091272 TaxID=3365981 RepID=UPI0038057F32